MLYQTIKRVCCLLTSLFLLSCNDHAGSALDEVTTVFTFSDFKDNKELIGEELHVDNLLYPGYLEVIPEENLLIALEMEGAFFGKVYTLDSLHFITQFIEKGKGPDAQLSTSSIQYVKEERVLYVGDVLKRQLYAYAVDSILSGLHPIRPIKVVDFHNEPIMKPIVLKGQRYVDLYSSFNTDSIASMGFYDLDGTLKEIAGTYPNDVSDFNPPEWLNVFMSGLNTSADGDKILLNYYFTDYLDMYGADGKLEKRVHGPDGFEPIFKRIKVGERFGNVQDKEKAKRGYAGVAHMSDSVLVLYNGGSVKEGDYHVEKMLSFDENLVPSIIYQLDKPIFYFDVDWSTNTIYGLTHKGENNIVRFNLNE